MNKQNTKSNWISPWTLTAVASLTLGLLMSSCAPAERTPGSSGGGVMAPGASNADLTQAYEFTLTGSSGTATYPSSGLLTGVDNSLVFTFAAGSYSTTTTTGFTPYYSCAGFTVQLQRVMNDGSVSNVGNSASVQPMKVGSGSAFCDAQAGSLGLANAPTTLTLRYNSSQLVKMNGIAGYRLAISSPQNDYKYQDCVRGCANTWDCNGWSPNTWGTPEQRCAQYPMAPLIQTTQGAHQLKGKVAVQMNQ